MDGYAANAAIKAEHASIKSPGQKQKLLPPLKSLLEKMGIHSLAESLMLLLSITVAAC